MSQWLCLHFPDLPAAALGFAAGGLDAVADSHGSQRWLISAAEGARAGIPVQVAHQLQPQLRVHARNPRAERDTLRTLAYAAYRFGSPVACAMEETPEPGRLPRALVWVEVGASRRLFGDLRSLRDQLVAGFAELGQAPRLALAPTRAGGALLARTGGHAADLAQLHARLARLPLAVLPWPGALLAELSGVGLRTLGELFALPRDAFTRRFGAQRLLELDQLRGRAPEPCRPVIPPLVYRRRFELLGEVETSEGLLFPLRRLVAELAAYLRARDTGLRSLRLVLVHRAAETPVDLSFVAPHRDASRIFDSLREKLSRLELSEPVRELRLHAQDFAEAVVPQHDLFDDSANREQQWGQALERVAARLGEQAVQRVVVVEDHRPEGSTAPAPFSRPSTRLGTGLRESGRERGPRAARNAGSAGALSPALPRKRGRETSASPRPAWLLPEAEPIALASEPATLERIHSGWWDGCDVARDYGTVEIDGAHCWVYFDRADGRWYLHGYWA
ncbi:MAG TPA: DNA polymerase Y family protein [Solimonas sp.]|nr:DNA polymerase Y family protein [Solimonas sp.]